MSVINKMLQDLDARKGKTVGFSADYQPVKPRPYALWALILLIVVVATAWLYFNAPAAQALLLDKAVEQGNRPSIAESVALNSLIDPGTQPENLVYKNQLAEDVSEVALNGNGPNLVTTKAPGVETQTTKASGVETQTTVALDEAPAAGANNTAAFNINSASNNPSQAGLKQNINNALAIGNTLVAIEGLQRLLSSEPTNLKARKKLASLLFAENRIDQAKLVLQQGLSLHSLQGDLRLMLAKLLTQQGSGDSAIQLLKEYSPSAVAQPRYYAYRGALAQRLGLFSQAEQDYLLLSNTESFKAKWWLGLAIAQDSQGNAHQARQSYVRADDGDQLSPQVIQFVHKRINDLMGVK